MVLCFVKFQVLMVKRLMEYGVDFLMAVRGWWLVDWWWRLCVKPKR